MVYNKEEVAKLLKELGIDKISAKEEEILRKKVEFYGSMEPIKKELEVLFALNKVLISSYQRVSIENMDKIDDSLDAELMVKLFMEYHKIKEHAKDKFVCLEKFKAVAEEILFGRKKVNKQIRDMALDESSRLVIQDSLYMSMLDKDKADKLLDNCIRRSKLFLSNCDGENLKRLIDCLKSNFDLSENELVRISTRCATFFAASSVSKLNNLNRALTRFRDFVSNRLSASNDESAKEALSRDFKDILINSSLLATKDSNTIDQTIEFLMGKPAGSIISVNDKYADLKGDFTPSQLARIYDKSITSLGMGVDHIVDFTREISEVYKKIYNKELNLEGFINGRNFTGLARLSKKDYTSDGKIEEILRSLSMFFNAENMESLLKNNVAFLECEVTDVNQGLKEALMESSNKDDLRRSILSRIRNSFGINEGEFVEVERKKGPVVGKLHKVEIMDVEEEKMEQLLSRYGVASSERERWKRDWNKESKEYRDLGVQIALEELLEEIEVVKSMIPFGFDSIERFVEETDTVEELLKECEEKCKEIIYENKLNKNLAQLSIKVEKELMLVRSEINNNYERIVNWYSEELEELRKNLAKNEEALKGYDKKNSEYMDLLSYINEHDVDESYIEYYEKEAKTLETIVKNTTRIMKKNEKLLETCVDKNSRMYDIFVFAYGEFAVYEPIIYRGVELTAEDLFIIMNKNFEKMGIIEAVDDTRERKIPIPSYEAFLSLLSKDEAECVEELKEDLKEYNRRHSGLLENLNALLDHYGREGAPIKTEDEAFAALKDLCEQVEEVLSNAKHKFNRSRLLEQNLEQIDIESIKEQIESLSKSIEEHLTKIEKTKGKIK